MSGDTELRSQLLTALEDAEYPVFGPTELIPVLPDGPATTFRIDSTSMTAMEIYSEVAPGDFPYENAEAIVEDVIEELEATDQL